MKANDKKLYAAFAITAAAIAIILASISAYSLAYAEPKIERLLNSTETLKEAYIALREPQLFAGYRNWDQDGSDILNTIRYFDKHVFYGAGVRAEEAPYLFLLLERRHAGAMLGIKTAAFMFLLAACGSIAFLIEAKSLKES